MAATSLVAQRTFPYAGRTLVAGECFVARSAFDAVLLTTTGQAVPADPHAVDDAPGDDVLADDPVPVRPTRRRRRRLSDPSLA